MQTKSYRLLKWTLLACVTASLASACVVTTGDGGDDDDDFNFGGEGGTTSAGTTSTAGRGGSGGTSSSAGTSSGGTSSGGTSSGGSSTAGTSSGGSGGTAPSYMAGQCDDATPDQVEGPTPSKPADATPKTNDNACLACLKKECETEWSTCYGTDPTTACGWGPDADHQNGQFDCIIDCFYEASKNPMGTAEEALVDCSDSCTNQCDVADNGNVTFHTSELVSCANDPEKCQADCFAF